MSRPCNALPLESPGKSTVTLAGATLVDTE